MMIDVSVLEALQKESQDRRDAAAKANRALEIALRAFNVLLSDKYISTQSFKYSDGTAGTYIRETLVEIEEALKGSE